MELRWHVDKVLRELSAAAESGGAEAREHAERLLVPLSSAVQLMLLDVLSTAAEEITRELVPGSVELRLRGLDPSFVVTLPADQVFDGELEEDAERQPGSAPHLPAVIAPAPIGGDEGAISRINFRPPEYLKARIEQAARQEQLSVNTWLVRAVSAVLEFDARAQRPERRAVRSRPRDAQRYTGWVV
ncbi:hypothetical protein ACFWF7_21810 [Nocardia sp. NPDC060256]|uniref:hypothetical protein n=1 Tax=unclassified Nocardia TaxID=2637762 RepID=UPI0036537514